MDRNFKLLKIVDCAIIDEIANHKFEIESKISFSDYIISKILMRPESNKNSIVKIRIRQLSFVILFQDRNYIQIHLN